MAQDEALRPLSMESFRILNLGTPTAANDATKTDNSSAPANPAAAAAAGNSFLASPMNHVHQGVHGVKADANPLIYGDITFASGTGIALSQSGNTVTVASTVNAVNKLTLEEEGQVSVTGTAEEIILEYNLNFDDAGAGVGNNLQVRLSGIMKVAAGVGDVKVYVGATAPGATTGGTVRATISSTSTTFEQQTDFGAAFTNPGGDVLVQIVAVNDTAATKTTARGVSITIG